MVTEADIIARRHELEQAREETHKKQIEELEARVREMEEKKRELERQGRDDLHKLILERRDLEEKLKACLEQQEQCIKDIKETQAKEIQGYKQELVDLQKSLAEERNELVRKQGLIAELEAKKADEEAQRTRDQETLKELIKEEEANLERLVKEHEGVKNKYKSEADARVQAFKEESDHLNSNIEDIKKEIETKTQEFKKQETELERKKDELQAQLDKERTEREKKLAPLTSEKEALTQKIQEIQNKIITTREQEEKKTEEIIKHYEETLNNNQKEFEKEKEAQTKTIFDKECQIRDKELELEKLKNDNEEKLREIESEMVQKLKDMEEELRDQDEKNRKELQQVVDKDRYKELEDQIHQKQCELQNLEANQEAEEALLRVWLETVTDKEKVLHDEASAKESRYSNKISSLENQLNSVKQKADNEQRQYDALKEEIERKLQDKREQFEAHARDATTHINDLNNQIADLKRNLKSREAAAKSRNEAIDRRIGDEVHRLGSLKKDLEEQIEPLKRRHNELKQTLAQEKENYQAQLSKMQKEQHYQTKEQEEELNKLYSLLENVRAQFKEERNQLQKALKEILDSNDKLREKHEKEIFELNMKLVQTLETSSKGKIDPNQTKDLLNKVKDLQDEYGRKSREYEEALTRQTEEKHKLAQRNEKEIQQLKSDISKLSKEYLKDGVSNPEERVQRLKELLEKKSQQLEKAKLSNISKSGTSGHPSSTSCALVDEVEDAKRKNIELSEKFQQKKKDLNTLMNQRQSEIEQLTRQIEEQNVEMSKAEEPYEHKPLPGTLTERLDKLKTLRGIITSELHEREKLIQEISRLQKEPQEDEVKPLEEEDHKKIQYNQNIDDIPKCVLDGMGPQSYHEHSTGKSSKLKTKSQKDTTTVPTMQDDLESEKGEWSSRKPSKSKEASVQEKPPATVAGIEEAEKDEEIQVPSDTSQPTVKPVKAGPDVATSQRKSAVDYILEMIQEKENQLNNLTAPQLPPEKHEDLQKVKQELEELREQLPDDYERKVCHYQRGGKTPMVQMTTELNKQMILAGNDDINLVGKSYDKTMSYSKQEANVGREEEPREITQDNEKQQGGEIDSHPENEATVKNQDDGGTSEYSHENEQREDPHSATSQG